MAKRILLFILVLLIAPALHAAEPPAAPASEDPPPLHRMPGHRTDLTCIAVSPDGTRAVTGSDDRSVRVWDLISGKEIHCFRGHLRTIRCVAISPDGRLVASGSQDATAKVWDTATGELIADFDSHPQMVISIAFHPDGKRVWTGCCDHLLRLWDIESETVVEKLQHMDCVYAVDTLPDGSRVVAGLANGTVTLWDLRSRAKLHDMQAPRSEAGQGERRRNGRDQVSHLAFSPDGQRIRVVCDISGTRTLDAQSGTIAGQAVKVSGINGLSPDGRLVVVRGEEMVQVRDADDGRVLATVRPRSSARAAAISKDHKRLVIACNSWVIPAKDKTTYAVEVYDLEKLLEPSK